MKIIVHRGLNQIGGNIVEIESEMTRILFDIGLDLNPDNNVSLPEISDLFDNKGFDAVFISHYHSDHLGLVYEINENILVYVGEQSYQIIKASNNFLQRNDFKIAGFLKHKVPIQIGNIKVTPYLCDHSAFDSYMLFAESVSGNALYTGDFRANGRKPSDWLFSELPQYVEYLICEGTTLSRPGYVAQTEKALETETVELIKAHTGPTFVLQSSMNIDRIVTMYRAALRNNRIFLMDTYLAEITSAIRNHIPNPIDFEKVRVFLTYYLDDQSERFKLFSSYGNKTIKMDDVAKSNFVMCVRPSMMNYLEKLSQKMSFKDGLLIYSFWSGYLNKPEMIRFIEKCEELGLKKVILHTSGHADEKTLARLIDLVKPKWIIPIHTENAKWFATHYPQQTIIS